MSFVEIGKKVASSNNMSDKSYWQNRAKDHGEKGVKDLDVFVAKLDDELRKHSLENSIKIERGMKILDLGCGSGYWSQIFALKGGHVTGIDFVEGFIEKASHNAKNAGLSINYIVANVEDYINNSEKYDLVFSATVLQHITDENRLKKAISNIWQNLKPNGRAIIIEYAPMFLNVKHTGGYMNLKTRNDWVRKFSENGFSLNWERGVRVISEKICRKVKSNAIYNATLFLDKIITAIPIISERFCDTRLMIFKKVGR